MLTYVLKHNLDPVLTDDLAAVVTKVFDLRQELSALAGVGLFVLHYPMEYAEPTYGRVLNEVHLKKIARQAGVVRLFLEDNLRAKYALLDLYGPTAAQPLPTISERHVALGQLIADFLPARPAWRQPA